MNDLDFRSEAGCAKMYNENEKKFGIFYQRENEKFNRIDSKYDVQIIIRNFGFGYLVFKGVAYKPIQIIKIQDLQF